MKKIALKFATIAFLTLLVGCKNEEKETVSTIDDTALVDSNIEGINNMGELALANANDALETQYLYVTAPSGLSLRAYGNLQSDKLARMPYGTKVKVISSEENKTMTIGGIQGGMHEVEFNHKKGYAFNGYLSKYFPPELDISAKGYAEELQKVFPAVLYKETTGGTASAPSNTKTITLPESKWHEAFYIAQRLFDFPKEFAFPNSKGKPQQTIPDSKPKKGAWISELQVTRSQDSLESIVYFYAAQKFESKVTISKDGNAMKISKTETMK